MENKLIIIFKMHTSCHLYLAEKTFSDLKAHQKLMYIRCIGREISKYCMLVFVHCRGQRESSQNAIILI